MEIGLVFRGRISMDDQGHVINVNASSSNVGCNEGNRSTETADIQRFVVQVQDENHVTHARTPCQNHRARLPHAASGRVMSGPTAPRSGAKP